MKNRLGKLCRVQGRLEIATFNTESHSVIFFFFITDAEERNLRLINALEKELGRHVR